MSPVTADKVAQCANPGEDNQLKTVEEMGNVRLHGLPMSDHGLCHNLCVVQVLPELTAL